ncbi:MAG: leucine--tRNA ligase, partial [Candidatus Zixiibacteriota bacterium]
MEYNHKDIEPRWQEQWKKEKIYQVTEDISKPKFYVLDMFPYPSGAGLHVGHPLGYIASDIYARYKHLKGFNVLHPMGFDAFGLPAEQYAIQTGQHPAETTKKNIARYKEQLGKIGFNYDWNREVITSNPQYYKWTQWTFIQLFHHWFDNNLQKARPVSELISVFSENGTTGVNAACTEEINFTANEWKNKTEKEQQEILLNYRLAYLADSYVNWCPELGTVLANDEVSNGVSVRGGYPVEQRKMKQWLLRVSAYANRLLNDLEKLEWTDSLKEIQRNWIGKSVGAELTFKIHTPTLSKGEDLGEVTVFTTRPDTIYGVSFMVLAPESELVNLLTSTEQQKEVDEYLKATKKRTERERLAEVKKVTGVFSGSYAIHPITGEKLPIWIADYVLAGYGTGAVMAVPAHDSRDFDFAKHFDLPILQVVSKKGETTTDTDTWQESYDSKEGIIINSPIINGLEVKKAMEKIINYFEEK